MDDKEGVPATKEAAVHATLNYPWVSDELSRNANLLTDDLVFGKKTGADEIRQKVENEVRTFAKEIAEMSLSQPVGAPDLARDDWKGEYANKCNEAVLQGKEIDNFVEKLKDKIIPLLPPGMDQNVSRKSPDSGFILATGDILNRVSQVSNMFLAGYDPELLRLSPEEVAAKQERLSGMMQEAGKDVSITWKGLKKK